MDARMPNRTRLRNSMNQYGLGKCKQIALKDFQKLVRMTHADHNGNCKCVTCGVVKPWDEMHGGHFLPGRRNGVCFDPRNVHPQCVKCNRFLSGNPVRYLDFMMIVYGAEVVEELRQMDRQTVNMTRDDYADRCMEYRAKMKIQAQRLGESIS